MYKVTKPGSNVVIYAVGGAGLGLATILMLAYCGESSSYYSEVDEFGQSSTVNPLTVDRVHLGLVIVYFLVSVFVIAELIGLLVMMRGKVRSGSLKVLIPLLCIMLFGDTIAEVIWVGRELDYHFETFGGYVTYILFTGLFQTMIYVFLFIIGETQVIRTAVNTDTTQQPAAAYGGGPGIVQSEQPQPYTHGQPVMYNYAPAPGYPPQYAMPAQSGNQPMPVYMQYPQPGMNGQPPFQQQTMPLHQHPVQYPPGAGPATRMVGEGGDISPELVAPKPAVGGKLTEPDNGRAVSPQSKGSELP
jgi:hypothetical protein